MPITTTNHRNNNDDDYDENGHHENNHQDYEDTTNVLLREPLLENNNNDNDDDSPSVPPSFRGLLLFKALYFWSGLSSATWGRFGIIYYNTVRHLTPNQIGVLQGVTPLVAFVSQPLWGWVSDYTLRRKNVYVFCKLCSTLCLLSLALPIVDTFGKILACVVSLSLFRSSGVLDAHTLDFLHASSNHRSMYGTIRMWAAISWGLGAVVMGYVTDRYGFNCNFAIFGTMMLTVLLLTVVCLPNRSQSELQRFQQRQQQAQQQVQQQQQQQQQQQEVQQDDTFVQEQQDPKTTTTTTVEEEEDDDNNDVSSPRVSVLLRAVCYRWEVLFWLLELMVIGAGMSLVDSFLFVHLQSDLGASATLCGWTVGVTVLMEIPIMGHGAALLKQCGQDVLWLVGLVAYAVRVWGYTLLTPQTVSWVLGLEILHGITFGCVWIASVDYAATVAPPAWSTTVQTLPNTVLYGIGGGVGPVVGGWVYQHCGGAVVLYRTAGTMVGLVFMVHLLLWGILRSSGSSGGGGLHDAHLQRVQRERQEQEQEREQDEERRS